VYLSANPGLKIETWGTHNPLPGVKIPLENLVEGNVEDLCDAEGSVQCWGVFACFDGGDGLACEADSFTEFGLGHLAILEAQSAHSI
jgi:hypothetical protein